MVLRFLCCLLIQTGEIDVSVHSFLLLYMKQLKHPSNLLKPTPN